VDYWSGHGLQIRAIHIRTILHIRAIGNDASDYDSNGYDSTGYDSTGHDSDGYSDPNLQENYKRRWFVDKDNDNHSSEVVYFDPFEVKYYPYKLTVFGPDRSDMTKISRVR
jgi:hypothetical protein